MYIMLLNINQLTFLFKIVHTPLNKGFIMANEKKESFLLYLEHQELIKELSNEQAGELFKGLFDYVATNVTPDFKGAEKLAFISIRQDLDRNAKKYKEVSEKRRLAGASGAKQKAINLANANFAKKFLANLPDNVNDNDNDNDNVNVNENVNVNVNVNSSSSSSSSSPSDEKCYNDVVTEEEKEYLKKHIELNRADVKNVEAYANRMIANGDYLKIISEYRKEQLLKSMKAAKEERKMKEELLKKEQLLENKKKEEEEKRRLIKQQLSEITDKISCAKVLINYNDGRDAPKEFEKFKKLYDLDTEEKVRKTFFDYLRKKNTILT